MRICIDIDGTICETRQLTQSYADVKPIEGATEALQQLRSLGHYIIFYTARHMKTCDGNVGKVVARQGNTLLSWLENHGIEYDEIWFGKPYADLYIDDHAIAFENWSSVITETQRRQRESTEYSPQQGGLKNGHD